MTTKKKRGRPKKKKAIKKPAVEKPAIEKPAIEKSDVETTPWPRAVDNKKFEEILGKEPDQTEPRPDEPKQPEEPGLKINDVAEWVKWPFQIWSTSQDLPPIIKPAESLEIAEPLTRILNRHGVGEKIPPDVIDGMQVAARTIPVIKHGNDIVKLERQRRAKAGQGKEARPGRQAPQGAPASKPKEV